MYSGLILVWFIERIAIKWNENEMNWVSIRRPQSYSLSAYDIFALWMFSSRFNEYHIEIHLILFCSISNEVSNVIFYRLTVKLDYFVAVVILTGETVSVVQYGLCRLCPHRGLKGPTWHPAQKHNLSVPPGNAPQSGFSHRGNSVQTQHSHRGSSVQTQHSWLLFSPEDSFLPPHPPNKWYSVADVLTMYLQLETHTYCTRSCMILRQCQPLLPCFASVCNILKTQCIVVCFVSCDFKNVTLWNYAFFASV